MLLAHTNISCKKFNDIIASGYISSGVKTGTVGMSDINLKSTPIPGVTEADLIASRNNIYFTAIQDSEDSVLGMLPCCFIFPASILKNIFVLMNPVFDFGRNISPEITTMYTKDLFEIEHNLNNVRKKRIAIIRKLLNTSSKADRDEYIRENNWRLNEVVIQQDIPITKATYCTIQANISNASLELLKQKCPKVQLVIIPLAANMFTLIFINIVYTQLEKQSYRPMSQYTRGIDIDMVLPESIMDKMSTRTLMKNAYSPMELNSILVSIRTSPSYENIYTNISLYFFNNVKYNSSLINDCTTLILSKFITSFAYDPNYAGYNFYPTAKQYTTYAKKVNEKYGSNPELIERKLLLDQLYARVKDFCENKISLEELLYVHK